MFSAKILVKISHKNGHKLAWTKFTFMHLGHQLVNLVNRFFVKNQVRYHNFLNNILKYILNKNTYRKSKSWAKILISKIWLNIFDNKIEFVKNVFWVKKSKNWPNLAKMFWQKIENLTKTFWQKIENLAKKFWPKKISQKV